MYLWYKNIYKETFLTDPHKMFMFRSHISLYQLPSKKYVSELHAIWIKVHPIQVRRIQIYSLCLSRMHNSVIWPFMQVSQLIFGYFSLLLVHATDQIKTCICTVNIRILMACMCHNGFIFIILYLFLPICKLTGY